MNSINVTEDFFRTCGGHMATKKDKLVDERTFVAFYGTTPNIVLEVWEYCERPTGTHPKHLLWALMYLKLYNSLDVMAVLCGTSKPTFNKWIWPWIDSVAVASQKIVSGPFA
jgi:hypothetical protein